MRGLKDSIRFVKQNSNTFIVLELAYFGTVLFGMIIVYFFPNLQDYFEELTEQELQSISIGRIITKAYDKGEFWKAGILTFLGNLTIGTLFSITIPSFIIPFSGLILAFYRALLWGFLFSPIKANSFLDGYPHLITLLIEGEAYILAILPVWLHCIQSKMIFNCQIDDDVERRGGYKAWLKIGYELNLRIFPLIVYVLLFAAFYEAYEVIYLLPPSTKKYGH